MVKPTHKKKTVYDRAKTMEDKLLDYNIADRDTILEDFKKLLVALDKRTTKPFHVGCYDYFILRLASRRGIQVIPLTEEEVRRREWRMIAKKVEESVRKEYKGLPYNKELIEEMWDRIHEEIRKVRDGGVVAPEVPRVSVKPTDIKTPDTRNGLDETLYGEGGVYKTLGWELSPNDAYHSEYLKSGRSGSNILNTPKVGEWHCNACNLNFSACNKSKHEKNKKHVKKLKEKGVVFDADTRKYTQSDGEVFDIGYYNNKITFS